MTQDLAALARDVDRLFRARQDGRQMPVGERFESAGGWVWKPAPEEMMAAEVADTIVETERRMYRFRVPADPKDGWVDTDKKTLFRTLRHVAMLALSAPEFFQRCVDTLDGYGDIKPFVKGRTTYVEMLSMPLPLEFDSFGGRMVMKRTRRAGRAAEVRVRVPYGKTKADVARTHRYLVDLDRRLREWREAQAAVAAATAENRKAAKEATDRADEMAAAERDGDLACFEETA